MPNVNQKCKIIHLHEIANQLPDAFTDTKRVTKSYITVVNTPARIEIPKGQSENEVTNESKTRLKRVTTNKIQR